jgi:predicted DNA-binding transcriptional regulator YafY
VRADRLVSLVLLLQARGHVTAAALARELEVSVRTVYRDLAALSAAGVPVLTESGPGGGCGLLDGYRFPLRGLRPEEAEALLILGVPSALGELGLEGAAAAAHRKIRVTAGQREPDGGGSPALVHLDMPRWFRGQEQLPHLRTLAEALRRHRRLAIAYQPADTAGTSRAAEAFAPPADTAAASRAAEAFAPPADTAAARRAAEAFAPPADTAAARRAAEAFAPPAPSAGRSATTRTVGPLGLVNKAGTWYLVATRGGGRVSVFRAGRIAAATILDEPFDRPADFDLAGFWDRWSAEFTTSRPRLPVRLRASPQALAAFGEIFGDDARPVLDAAGPPDELGWQTVTLSFEHELAAAHRLAGFGGQVEVLSPPSVRALLVAAAQGILDRYASPALFAALEHEQCHADDR